MTIRKEGTMKAMGRRSSGETQDSIDK
jgi:hypothetical protein